MRSCRRSEVAWYGSPGQVHLPGAEAMRSRQDSTAAEKYLPAESSRAVNGSLVVSCIESAGDNECVAAVYDVRPADGRSTNAL